MKSISGNHTGAHTRLVASGVWTEHRCYVFSITRSELCPCCCFDGGGGGGGYIKSPNRVDHCYFVSASLLFCLSFSLSFLSSSFFISSHSWLLIPASKNVHPSYYFSQYYYNSYLRWIFPFSSLFLQHFYCHSPLPNYNFLTVIFYMRSLFHASPGPLIPNFHSFLCPFLIIITRLNNYF